MMSKMLSPNRLVVFVALCAVSGLMGVGFSARADGQDAPPRGYTWTAPEEGTPVDHYVAQVLVSEVDTLAMGPLPSEYALVEMVYGNKYSIRVAGVDAQGNQGPYSEWSDPFTPELGLPDMTPE